MFNFIKNRKYKIKTCLRRPVLGYAAQVKKTEQDIIRIMKALSEKHDSKTYADSLVDSITAKIVDLQSSKPYILCMSKRDLLERIEDGELNKHTKKIAPNFIVYEDLDKFSKNEDVINMIDYDYNVTEMHVIYRLAMEQLTNIDNGLIEKMEQLRVYKEISCSVNALQYLTDKLYKLKAEIIKFLNKSYLDIENKKKPLKQELLKKFRKAVWEINKTLPV